MPALAPGSYYVLVQVDSLYQVPDPNRANNTLAASTGQIDVAIPALTLGTPYSDSFTAADQDRYYQITVIAGGSLLLTMGGSPPSENNAIYVRLGALPTAYLADFQTSPSAGPDPARLYRRLNPERTTSWSITSRVAPDRTRSRPPSQVSH